MKCQIISAGENKKNINSFFVEFAHSMLDVNLCPAGP